MKITTIDSKNDTCLGILDNELVTCEFSNDEVLTGLVIPDPEPDPPPPEHAFKVPITFKLDSYIFRNNIIRGR